MTTRPPYELPWTQSMRTTGTAVPVGPDCVGEALLAPGQYAMVNQFLQHVCVDRDLLKQDHIELCNTLSRIFDGDRAASTISPPRRCVDAAAAAPGEILPGVDGVGRCADDDEIMKPNVLNLEEFTCPGDYSGRRYRP